MCLSLIRNGVILVRRKQQCPEAIPHSDNFAHSNFSDCLLIGVLGSLETLCNSEQMRFVVYGFPKLNCKGRPHFVSRVMAIKYVTSQLQLASSLGTTFPPRDAG